MKTTKTMNRALMLTLLTAILVLPMGANKQAMANNGGKIYNGQVTTDQSSCCNDEEEYSLPVIRFFSLI